MPIQNNSPISACRLPCRAGEAAVKNALETLAGNYFRQSVDYPGAPVIAPDRVSLQMNSTDTSRVLTNHANHRIAELTINNEGVREFCQNPLPKLNDCDDINMIHRTYLLKGLENHSPQKKEAVLLIQLMLQEVSELQEIMGARSATMPSHNRSAKQAALRTNEELRNTGSELVEDGTVPTEDGPSQRTIATNPMQLLPHIDVAFKNSYGSSLMMNDVMQKWIHSPEMIMDLRSLAEPSARLQLQVSPLAAQALLESAAFRATH